MDGASLLTWWDISTQSIYDNCFPESQCILLTKYQVTGLAQGLSGTIIGGYTFSVFLNCPCPDPTSSESFGDVKGHLPGPGGIPGAIDTFRSVSRRVEAARKPYGPVLFLQALETVCCPVPISPNFCLPPTPDRLQMSVKSLQYLFSWWPLEQLSSFPALLKAAWSVGLVKELAHNF